MEKPIKTIIGEVMDKTENSIQIKKIWIKFFDSSLIKDIKVNDNVEIKYSDNPKGDKIYHNGSEIKVISTAKLTNVNISDSTINTLVMSIKEIYISQEGKKSLKDITTDVIASYKQIVSNISK